MGLLKLLGEGIVDVLGGGVQGLAGAAQSAMWKEYFVSGDLSEGVLMKRGEKVIVNGSKNTKADDNLISNGSGIDVQEGQCMILVSNGKIVDMCAEAGRYTYQDSSAPSFLLGSVGSNSTFKERIKSFAQEILNQWSAGGQRFSTQRVYYINLGRIYEPIKWGLGNVAFKHRQVVLDGAAPIMRNVMMKAHGTVCVGIGDPVSFYQRIGAQRAGADGNALITMNSIGDSIFLTAKNAISNAISKSISEVSNQNIMAWTEIPQYYEEISQHVTEMMAETALGKDGFAFYDFLIDGSPELRQEDYEALNKMETEWSEKAFMASNATMANYDIQKTFAKGFENAGANGGAQGIMGLGVAMGGGGFGNFGNLQQQPAQQAAPQAAAVYTAAPAAANAWECPNCHQTVQGNFCVYCGTKKAVEIPKNEWTCPQCGRVNNTNFCADCGTRKPVVKKIKCDKCGWEPKPGDPAPRFCPNCGDPINDADYTE